MPALCNVSLPLVSCPGLHPTAYGARLGRGWLVPLLKNSWSCETAADECSLSAFANIGVRTCPAAHFLYHRPTATSQCDVLSRSSPRCLDSPAASNVRLPLNPVARGRRFVS